ncbi:DUF5676 family membrane protein [Massilia scottii]|uniref:DUF5676 family membrane protein n=1 Tax=Massilia scottii TaxID=3057166 RepID=UPI0027964781|nr:DUF5676 family membrane protein [Massilia sp. CCM 9029]MDQ1831651.1 DUF5676 family membrane protein [Massilia sp. CCM 9029]
MKPLQTGLALAVTVALFYSFCSLIDVLWPEQFVSFMDALFHGMDFRAPQSVTPHPWRDYFSALIVVALCAFIVGALFAALYRALDRVRLHRSLRYG